MAHELRNPLASLKGHAQLLAEDLSEAEAPNQAKQKERAERVVGDAERLETLTKNLLEFVRDGAIDVRPIAPRDVIADALADLPEERVEVHLERAPAEMVADRARVARAVHNLVDNALQASPAGSSVEISLAEAGGDVEIAVRDHGEGLAGKETHIFEPFVTTRVRGTGLGLPIARRIAEQHDGTLVGETHPEGGAVFRMHLPRAARPG